MREAGESKGGRKHERERERERGGSIIERTDIYI